MAIGDDFEVQADGDIRYTGTTTNYTVLELHRWLQGLADDAAASGDDFMDITEATPSSRSTDNIIELLSPFNIDDTAAQHLYDGSILQANGDTLYSGLVVVGAVEAGTALQLVQNNALLSDTWTAFPNADAAQNILLRLMVKTRTAGADIDGKRLRVQAREYTDTYAEFLVTLGQGNATAAIFTANDLNNQTASGTVAGYTCVNLTEGYNGIDVTGDGNDEFYYSEWDKGSESSLQDLYEFTKYIGRRGTAETLYGMGGALFRGITHQVAVSGGAGTWVQNETVSWGAGATAGTGKLLAADNLAGASTTKLWLQLVTGAAPASGTATGAGGATGTIGVVTARTVSPAFLGASTGSAIIGAYGIGIDANDLGASDQLFDLGNTLRNPPNNVTFDVGGLIVGEDRVLVGPEAGGTFDVAQLTLNTSLSGASETQVVVTTAIPGDTPSSGTLRVLTNGGIYKYVEYSSWSGSTFNITPGAWDDFVADPATAPKNVFISYIDILATATTESFTGVFVSTRSLYIRVRDGGASPIKTFETTGSLGAAGGSTTAIRTPDA